MEGEGNRVLDERIALIWLFLIDGQTSIDAGELLKEALEQLDGQGNILSTANLAARVHAELRVSDICRLELDHDWEK